MDQKQSVRSHTSSFNTGISYDKPPRKKRGKKLKIKRKKKDREQNDDQARNLSPNSEHTPLVINATFREPPEDEAKLEEAKRTMFVSHLVANFSEVGWQFCLILFLTALTKYQSLTLVATYGLFTGIVVCLSGPAAGAMIDKYQTNRLEIAKAFIWVQNLSVIVATICCYFLLRSVPSNTSGNASQWIPDLAPPATTKTWLLLIVIHCFGALAKLSDASMTVALERDWIVVMAKAARGEDHNQNDSDEDSELNLLSTRSGDSDLSSLSAGNASFGSHTDLNNKILQDLKEKTWLTQTNTIMKQIDLVCRVASPAAAGVFFDFFDNYKAGDVIISPTHWDNLSFAALIIGLLNLISLLVENAFIQHIYDLVPLLGSSNGTNENIPKVVSKFSLDISEGEKTERAKTVPTRGKGKFKLSTIQSGITKIPSMKVPWDAQDDEDDESNDENRCKPFSLPLGLGTYMKQTIAFGGFALSLLYLNVLCFGALMTAYLVFRGMSYGTIGSLRGLSSVIGLMGTFAYRISSRRNSLPYTGTWSIIFQFTCLTLCYTSLYIKNDDLSLALLIIGVIASRIGLYVFDLSITQMMQQMIPEDIRGIVGGVQKSMNGFFELSTYGLGLVFSTPDDFHVLVATGYVSVGLAMFIYLWGIYRHKDEIEKALK